MKYPFPFLLLSLLMLMAGVKAQIPPLDSPYYEFGPYEVLSDSDMVASPAMFTFRPNVPSGETFPVFMFQLGANGFGSSAINHRSYDLFLKHLASYGYVVIIVNSTAAGLPNGNTFTTTYNWFNAKLADGNHWMGAVADPQRLVVGGHSNGGVNASAFLVNNPLTVKGIVYFASYPSPPDPFGFGGHNVSGYTGHVLSIAGTEDGSSTPTACKTGYNAFNSASCKYWVLVEGLGHGGFGDYPHNTQTVGSMGREPATATIRHLLVSFMEWTYKGDAAAEGRLKDVSLRPNTEQEFETTCPAIITGVGSETNPSRLSVFPNPVSDILHISGVAADATVTIRDMTGRTVLTTIGDHINVSSLPRGVYLLEAEGMMVRFVRD